MAPKPIKLVPRPPRERVDEPLLCVGCGKDISYDMQAAVTHIDTDKGDHIERRETDVVCGLCARTRTFWHDLP